MTEEYNDPNLDLKAEYIKLQKELEELKKNGKRPSQQVTTRAKEEVEVQEVKLSKPDVIQVRSLHFNDNPTFSSREQTMQKDIPYKEVEVIEMEDSRLRK